MWAMAREASERASMDWRTSFSFTFSSRNSSRYCPSLAETATARRAERAAPRADLPCATPAREPAKAEALEDADAALRITEACGEMEARASRGSS